jgi:hypothetical protein
MAGGAQLSAGLKHKPPPKLLRLVREGGGDWAEVEPLPRNGTVQMVRFNAVQVVKQSKQ